MVLTKAGCKGTPADLRGDCGIEKLETAVEDAAETVEYSTAASRRSCLYERPDALRRSESRCRAAAPGPERRRLRREARRLRRKWLAEKPAPPTMTHARIVEMKVGGRLTAD
eukprot:10606277-Lingulodinium_polyedra.AAC.1